MLKTQFEIDGTWTSVDDGFVFIDNLVTETDVSKEVIGYSVLNKPLTSVSVGNGQEVCLVTSGVHGSEPASRESLLIMMRDICYNADGKYDDLLNKFKVIFIPTLNPDRMFEAYRNAANIDINRVTYRLDSPEGIAFVKFAKDIDPIIHIDLHEHSGPTDKDMLYVRAMFMDPNSHSEVRKLQQRFIDDISARLNDDGFSSDYYYNDNTGFGSLTSGLGILGYLAVTMESSTREEPLDRILVQSKNLDNVIDWLLDNETEVKSVKTQFKSDKLEENKGFMLLQGMRKGAEMYVQSTQQYISLPYGYKVVESDESKFTKFIETYEIDVDSDGIIPINQHTSRILPHLLDPRADTRVVNSEIISSEIQMDSNRYIKEEKWVPMNVKKYN